MDVGLFVVRVVVGLLFVVHGTQKLLGWFGGYGIEGTSGFMASLRYRRPRLATIGAGTVETGAGLFLASGFLTPLAAAGIIGMMINAGLVVNRSKGLVSGYELDLVMATVATALAFTGAGAYSLDAALGWNLGGITWGLAALALGAVVGFAVLASRAPAAEQTVEAVGEGRRAA